MKRWKLLWRALFSEAWLGEKREGVVVGPWEPREGFYGMELIVWDSWKIDRNEVKKGITNVTRSRGDP